MVRRRWGLFGLVSFAVMLGVASVAWACTEQADLDPGPSGDVAVGSTVQVTGHRFVSGSTVGIHWDTADGPLLATATGPDVDVAVRIPAAEPGSSHHIVAVVEGTGYHAATTVTVEGTPTATAGTEPVGADDVFIPVSPTSDDSAAPSAAAAPSASRTAAPTRRVTASPTQAAVPAPSAADQAPTGAATAQPEPAAVAPAVPSAASVSADLWSGLTTAETRRVGPSLIGEVPAPGAAHPFTDGVALAAVLVGLMGGGLGLAVLGRRRARADVRR
ncbi:MAG TPA: hypothetical protein VHM89_02055 [Acidimicrobiales bacterium]|nr:hypothetical protein [Acidimicrobiales bacterium]